MKSKFNKSIDYFSYNPSLLFAIDGLGALLSAILIGFFIYTFEPYFGVLGDKILYLAIAPLFFAAFDTLVILTKPKRWKKYLSIIAIANTIYCLVTFSLLFNTELTLLGYIYFIVEIIIVMSLVYLEFKVAKNKT